MKRFIECVVLALTLVFGIGVAVGQVGIADIAGGEGHYIALRCDGLVLAWGRNHVGQLGLGTTGGTHTVPAQIPSLNGVIAISAGPNFSLAVRNDGTVWGWGNNEIGQLGNGTTTSSSTPVQALGLIQVVAIAGGQSHVLALKSDGTVWAWGSNNDEQLGNPSAPNPSLIPLQVPNFFGVGTIASGLIHSMALKSDGTVWTWGDYGGSIPQQNLPGISGVVAITAGYYHSLALKNNGTVWGWGSNTYGMLGNGTTATSTIPVQSTGLLQASRIASGAFHSLVVRSDGTIWTWGRGNAGQLGNGSTANSLVPTLVNLVNVGIAAKSFDDSSMVCKNDGTLWAWGDNQHGQLGYSSSGGSIPSPIAVSGVFGSPCFSFFPPPPPPSLCTAGTVNMAHGPPVNVLFVNGSPGNVSRIVNVAVNVPITITLAPPPFGPLPAPAVMWAWVGAPTSPTTLTAFGQSLGCMANPPSFMPTLSPQPFTDIPTYAPGLDYNPAGVSFPVVITLQGLMIDFGAGNPTWMSITNAVIVNVQ